MHPIIHIVPLAANPGGVADYALTLARAVSDVQPGGAVLFVGNGEFRQTQSLEITKHTPESIGDALAQRSADTAILHYANYGYAKRGCPFYLVEAIEKWKSLPSRRKLITIFHEIKASGPPWTSAFWVGPFQRKIAEQLLRLSDAAFTSLNLYRDMLVTFNATSSHSIHVLPVFSTVGEPQTPAKWKDRLPRMLVFGGKGARERVMNKSFAHLIAACNRLKIEEVYEIGPGPVTETSWGPIRLISCGELPADEVSRLMGDARAGFFDYPTRFLTKSTIFAAYCAHGLLPVTGRHCTGTEAGLQENVHYWNVGSNAADLDSESITLQALAWYRQHGVQHHVEQLIKTLDLHSIGLRA